MNRISIEMRFLYVCTMYKLLVPALLLVACSQNTPFCDCIEKGEALNNFSTSLFDKEVTSEDEEKMKSLKEEKEKACADYQTMSGEEMIKLREDCENFSMEVED